jgi:hypothetical protein
MVSNLLLSGLNSYPQKLSTGYNKGVIPMRNTALTSTYVNGFDSNGTLTAQSLSKAHRKPLRGVACGVLVAIGISLLLPYEAGSTNLQDISMTPKQYAYYSLGDVKQYKCIAVLYGKESAWDYRAYNKSSGTVGIPQGKSVWLLTATPIQQVEWGLRYIKHRYGTPCKALDHWKQFNWH